MARTFTKAGLSYLQHNATTITAVPLTLACWAKLADATTFHRLMQIGNSGNGDANHSMFLLQAGPTGNVQAYSAQGGATIVAGAAVTSAAYTANAWFHAAAVFTSSTSRTAYVDGSGASDATAVTPAGVNQINVGKMHWPTGSTDFYTDGSIAEAAIWSEALTAAEIAALARGFAPMQIRPQSLAAYWPLGGRYGQSDVDRWKNGYDLTAYNAPTWADHPRVIYPPAVNLPQRAASVGGATPWLYARRRSQVIGAGGVH